MKSLHDSELMAHADGELDETASRALEERLGHEAVSRGKVEAVGELGEIVRGHLELSADAVPQKRFDALWREIDKGIDREERATGRDAASVPAATAEAGIWTRLGRWFDRYRGHVLTGAVSAGAVAALALLLRNPTATNHEIASGSGREPGSAGQVLVKNPAEPAQPTQIDELDTPDGTGTVFNLEDEDGNTTVIWVTPEDTVEGI
jgi:hypothetical protein